MAASSVCLRRIHASSCLSTVHPSCQWNVGTLTTVPGLAVQRRAQSTGNTRQASAAVWRIRCSSQRDESEAKKEKRANRRDVLLAGAALVAATVPSQARSEDAPVAEALEAQATTPGERLAGPAPPAEDDSSFSVLTDGYNALSFKYPLLTAKKKEKLPWVETRHPERYSSAAPISSDARQRIVSERLDFTRSITCTVSVGPPSEIFLKGADPTGWGATAVANSVLMDRSSRRMSQGQRTAESEIEEAKTKTVDGIPYFYYEHIQQRSPTTIEKRADTFRHSYAVTAEREGYLYTLNISAPDVYWDDLEPVFKQAVESFRLLPPTKDYVPPWKDPWRFW